MVSTKGSQIQLQSAIMNRVLEYIYIYIKMQFRG